MDPRRFASADAFADALVKAVDEEFKPATPAATEETGDGDEDGGEDEKPNEKAAPQQRRSDGPGEGDNNVRATARRQSSGPWLKMSDAPREVQAEINRQINKLARSATKESREAFQTRALEAHYRIYQQRQTSK